MGLFRQIKSMSVEPPEGRAPAPPPPPVPDGPEFEPVGGVGLDAYCAVLRRVPHLGVGSPQALAVARSDGITEDRWREATAGWAERRARHPEVERQVTLRTAGT